MNERAPSHANDSATQQPFTTKSGTARSLAGPFLCGALAACGLLASAGLVVPQAAIGQPATAMVSDEENGGRVSAAEQRKEMITLLKSMSTRMDRIEAAMLKGINVKVTEMPAFRMEGGDQPSSASATAPSRPAPKQSVTTVRPKQQ